LCGYDSRAVTVGGRDFTVIVARPYAMGGNELSFSEALRSRYGIHSLEDSVERLCTLIQSAPTEDLLVLAHNGPLGLGADASDLWGCDFKPEAGDWGDEDLRSALDYAKEVNKRVRAVVAGHMHRGKRNPKRLAQKQQSDILFVNPAVVPRVFGDGSGMLRHHMVLEIDDDSVSARDIFVR
jgi:uncharacterized protein (TIGR04168 family)